MSNSSSKGTALITGASRGIGAVYSHPAEALDYDLMDTEMTSYGTQG